MASQQKQIINTSSEDLTVFIANNQGNVHAKLKDQFDLALIRACIELYGKNQSKIADVLGINRVTLRKQMVKVGLLKK